MTVCTVSSVSSVAVQVKALSVTWWVSPLALLRGSMDRVWLLLLEFLRFVLFCLHYQSTGRECQGWLWGDFVWLCPFQFQLIFKVVVFSWVNAYAMMPNSRDFSQDQGHCYFYFILLVNADPPFFFFMVVHFMNTWCLRLCGGLKSIHAIFSFCPWRKQSLLAQHPLMSWNPLTVLSALLTQAIRVSLRIDHWLLFFTVSIK